jgi:hypothetical protein
VIVLLADLANGVTSGHLLIGADRPAGGGPLRNGLGPSTTSLKQRVITGGFGEFFQVFASANMARTATAFTMWWLRSADGNNMIAP